MKSFTRISLAFVLGTLFTAQAALAEPNYRVGSFALKGSVKMAINERQLVYERIHVSLEKFGFKADEAVGKVPGDTLELHYMAGDAVKFSEALHCTLKLTKRGLAIDFNSSDKTGNGDLNPVFNELKKLLQPIFPGKKFNTLLNEKYV